jgi:prepilin-type N-terminal cleavage/methylation domain-containing protein
MEHNRNKLKKNHGYSLIELSICLGLIGIILGSGLAITNIGNNKEYEKISNAQLDEIEHALQMFVNRYKRLPCPARLTVANTSASFGIEDVCANAAPAAGVVQINAGTAEELWIGAVPTRTLGLSDNKIYDLWGNRITYAVPKSFATVGNQIRNAVAANATRAIRLQNEAGTQIYPLAATPANNPIVYILVSHGIDMRGGYNSAGTLRATCAGTQLDNENCDHTDIPANRDVIFRVMDLKKGKVTAGYFYDFVRWKSRIQIGAAALN